MARAERIESVVDRLAAALFAGAVVFAVFMLAPAGARAEWKLATGSGLLAYVGCAGLLRIVQPSQARFPLPDFGVAQLEFPKMDELLLTEQVELILTDADRLPPADATGELLLEDILNEIGPESRVVRLFDPASMPTPGELNARVRRHLDGESPSAAPNDASQALYDALAELKRALR